MGGKWKDYYRELLTENRPEFVETDAEQAHQQNQNEEEIEITLIEVKDDIGTLKNKRSGGPGGIVNELIQYGSQRLLRIKQQMFSKAYERNTR